MSTWTKIPETHIASVLGGMVGKTAGTVTTAVNKSLDKIEAKIEDLQKEATSVEKDIQALQASDSSEEANLLAQQKASNFNTKASREVAGITATLVAASTNLATILKILTILKNTVKALKVPLPPLKVLISVIKMLPLPQRFLIVSFTILESDLLEMLEQMIKQAEEEVSGIEMIVGSLEAMLQPTLDRIERIRAQIALLRVSCNISGASSEDRDVLDKAGLLDNSTGELLFSKIQTGLQRGEKTLCYGTPDIDLSRVDIANQLTVASEGDEIVVVPEASGTVDKTLLTEEELRDLNAGNQSKYKVLGYSNFSEKPGILKIDDWLQLLEIALDKLRNLPLSQELKDVLEEAWNIEISKKSEDFEEPKTTVTKFQWISPLGEVFNIEILEDEHSPRVAVRRFARVTDQGGTVILDGIKTFSTNIEVLLTEIKLQLEQITR